MERRPKTWKAGAWAWAIAGLAALSWGCGTELPTQAGIGDVDTPPVPAPLRVEPLAFVEDPLVLESLNGLRHGRAEALAVWEGLRAELARGDRGRGLAALRAAQATTAELASGSATDSEDAISVEILLLALSDARDAVAADRNR
ncbi:MAG: hypothetical protein ACREK5_02825 [Gemmatimonadota bacterium]